MAAKTRKTYSHHMMYPPGKGAGRMTTSFNDHLKLSSAGWSHSKRSPLKDKVVKSYKKEQGY